ncbi:hypothetical protein BGZ61DRAFT_137872 [Ilyonectria robusta]|uniref:uncharacterized protein n=1 Tax=Ilyonectria robusta TaxID=1079257 RepID=UPI001E8D6F33|nr:uncharacterized protein BGZ61DRAFT_137872 [Ilyonectria robusta]KAH8735281.1 hypothetical protein BGZ61DRAFT_137872 [Ilyonectria robusta]
MLVGWAIRRLVFGVCIVLLRQPLRAHDIKGSGEDKIWVLYAHILDLMRRTDKARAVLISRSFEADSMTKQR